MNSVKNLFRSKRVYAFDPVFDYTPIQKCDEYIPNRVYPIKKGDTLFASYKHDPMDIDDKPATGPFKSVTFNCPAYLSHNKYKNQTYFSTSDGSSPGFICPIVVKD